MSGKKAFLRLMRLRELEEEQSRQVLELSVGRHREIQGELAQATSRQAESRAQFVASAGEADTSGRCGAMLEMSFAAQQQHQAQLALQAADLAVATQRAEFLVRRTERRQVETLLRQQRSLLEIETRRRAQQILDDWYGRKQLQDSGAAASGPEE